MSIVGSLDDRGFKLDVQHHINRMSSEAEIREFLHLQTKGAQDVALAALREEKYPQPVYTRVLSHVSAALTPVEWGNVCHTIEKKMGYGIANIRLIGNDWQHVYLLVGGQRFDRLLSPRHGHSFDITDNGRCLPMIEHHDIALEAEKTGAEGVCVEYDIVELPDEVRDAAKPVTESRIGLRFAFKAFQCVGAESFHAPMTAIKLGYNHPVEKIILDVIRGSVDEVILDFPQFSSTLPLQKVSDTQFVIDFGEHTINFSRVDSALLRIVTTEDCVVEARAITLHVASSMWGMYGLMFTK